MKTQKNLELELEKNFSLFEKNRKKGETIFDIVEDLEKYNLRGEEIVEKVLQEFVDDRDKQVLEEIKDLLKEHLRLN